MMNTINVDNVYIHNVCKNCLHLPVNDEGNHQLIKVNIREINDDS